MPPVTVEPAQALVEARGIRAVLDEPGPGKQPARPADQPGELRDEESSDEKGLDGKQRKHRRDDVSLDGDECLGDDQPDHEDECLRDGAVFFFNDTRTTDIYILSLHDALPIFDSPPAHVDAG